ncbi:hypothetical protein DV515_00000216, partial [Chloebia gouldiae]
SLVWRVGVLPEGIHLVRSRPSGTGSLSPRCLCPRSCPSPARPRTLPGKEGQPRRGSRKPSERRGYQLALPGRTPSRTDAMPRASVSFRAPRPKSRRPTKGARSAAGDVAAARQAGNGAGSSARFPAASYRGLSCAADKHSPSLLCGGVWICFGFLFGFFFFLRFAGFLFFFFSFYLYLSYCGMRRCEAS